MRARPLNCARLRRLMPRAVVAFGLASVVCAVVILRGLLPAREALPGHAECSDRGMQLSDQHLH